jgi:hypothetical protein
MEVSSDFFMNIMIWFPCLYGKRAGRTLPHCRCRVHRSNWILDIGGDFFTGSQTRGARLGLPVDDSSGIILGVEK